MNRRIALLCCAFLMTALPALAQSPAAPLGNCELKALLASFDGPKSEAAPLENLNPLAGAQELQSTSCCTEQDRIDCFSNVPEGCYVERFYCYQGWFCYCGLFCN